MTQHSHSRRAPALLILVEDDAGVRRALQLLLQGQGFAVHSFAAAGPALADPDTLQASHAVIDYSLPDSDGITLVRQLRERGWAGEAILITAYPTPRLSDAARKAGVAAIIDKPFRDAQLLDALTAHA